jgi:DNA (cytosine-5)-methyltransferase 1
MSLGFANAGFVPCGGFDLDGDAVATYRHNFGENAGFVQDVTELTGEILLERCGLEEGELDVLLACPPCQSFSRANRTADADDAKNMLVNEAVRLVREVSPKAFVIENVPEMATRGQDQLQNLNDELSDYDILPGTYNASHYGVPQVRIRYIIVGVRKDLGCTFVPPPPTTLSKPVTVGEALAGLPVPPLNGDDHPDFTHHARPKLSQQNLDRLKCVPQGGDYQNIPWKLLSPCHQRAMKSEKRAKFYGVLGRLHRDRPANTITSGCNSVTKGRYGHPTQQRGITLREAARLMSFPDSFEFRGPKKSIALQIGNAVCVKLAEAIALQLRRCLEP